MKAPLTTNKNCDDLRHVSAGKTRSGGRIVANRGSYSAWRGKCKVGVMGGRECFFTLDVRF